MTGYDMRHVMSKAVHKSNCIMCMLLDTAPLSWPEGRNKGVGRGGGGGGGKQGQGDD